VRVPSETDPLLFSRTGSTPLGKAVDRGFHFESGPCTRSCLTTYVRYLDEALAVCPDVSTSILVIEDWRCLGPGKLLYSTGVIISTRRELIDKQATSLGHAPPAVCVSWNASPTERPTPASLCTNHEPDGAALISNTAQIPMLWTRSMNTPVNEASSARDRCLLLHIMHASAAIPPTRS